MGLLKRYLKTTAVTIVLSFALALTALAAEARINFSDPSVTAGSEVNVTMKVTSTDGTALGNATVVLTYPTEKLEFVSGTDADGGAGAIRVHGASNGSGTTTLEYNLKFNTISAGTANISVDSYEIYDTSDQPFTISHVGSSAVSINAAADAGSDCTLKTLEVYPGELDPGFSVDNTDYAVTIGTGVERLTINAIPTDSSSSVTIEGNEEIPMGDSAVTITVKAADGSSTAVYTINVSKVEGGAENVISEPETVEEETVEGVQLSSKGKTITIINPGEDVEIPEGFKQGTIKIDDQKVQGWVWGADDEPEYCVVYGVNDNGEVNFYRYDMVEKTIQRYFEDPIAVGAVSAADYSALEALKTAAETSAEQRFMIICGLAAVIFVMLIIIIFLTTRVRALSKSRKFVPGGGSAYEQRRRMMEQDEEDADSDVKMVTERPSSVRKAEERRRKSSERRSADASAQESGKSGAAGASGRSDGLRKAEELLKHDYSAESGTGAGQEEADETRLIRRAPVKRKRRPRHVTAGPDPDSGTPKPEDTSRAAAPQAEGSKGTQADSGNNPAGADEGTDINGIEDLDI